MYVVMFQDRHADPWCSVYTTADKARWVAFDYVSEAGWPHDRLNLTGLAPGEAGLIAHASVGDGGFVYVYAVPVEGAPAPAVSVPAEPRERTYGTPRPPGGAL